MLVCLDAGHGGKDPGAVSDSLIEKELNLELANICRSILMKGHDITMVRDVDEFCTIGERAGWANNVGADVFISLHHNASSSHRARGCEILYYPHTVAQNKKYAQMVVDRICDKHPIKNRGAKPGWYRGDKTKGVLGVLRRTRMPAYIIEAAFLDSPDRYYLLEDEKRWDLYKAIAKSIKEVLDAVSFT